MRTRARKTSPKKEVTRRRRLQIETRKQDTREDGISCSDCREPMTQVLTVTTFKWECRCLPGIHFCE
jgi:hypothetical protein